MNKQEECPKCGGQGYVIIHEYCDQYDRTHLDWGNCDRCDSTGSVEVEPEDDE